MFVTEEFSESYVHRVFITEPPSPSHLHTLPHWKVCSDSGVEWKTPLDNCCGNCVLHHFVRVIQGRESGGCVTSTFHFRLCQQIPQSRAPRTFPGCHLLPNPPWWTELEEKLHKGLSLPCLRYPSLYTHIYPNSMSKPVSLGALQLSSNTSEDISSCILELP